MFKDNKNSGQVMMVVVLVLSGIIVAATAVSGLLTVRQTRQTADSGSSAAALFVADAGLEWRMFKLYEDWKVGNVSEGDCADCENGLACDKKPSFINGGEKINNAQVTLEVVCTPIPSEDAYMYFNIKSTANIQSTSYTFEQTLRLIK